LVAKEEETVKMVDDSTCEVISTGIINVTGRDEMVHLVYLGGTVQSNIHRGARLIRMLDPSATQSHHG